MIAFLFIMQQYYIKKRDEVNIGGVWQAPPLKDW
jgi:hypothetical protein